MLAIRILSALGWTLAVILIAVDWLLDLPVSHGAKFMIGLSLAYTVFMALNEAIREYEWNERKMSRARKSHS